MKCYYYKGKLKFLLREMSDKLITEKDVPSMYETLNARDFDFLSEDDKDILNRISAYSAKILGEVEPGEVRISRQLEVLKPVMQEIADEKKIPLEDIFIRYMDLASLVLAKKDEKFKQDTKDFDLF